MFCIGDHVIKVNTGVCRITEIGEMDPMGRGEMRMYYTLVPEFSSKAKVYVPVGSDKTNMRLILSREQALDLISEIPDIEVAWIPGDKRREQEYKEAVRSNDPRTLISMIKNIYVREKERESQGKRITAVDDRYFKMAQSALYSELAASLGREIEEITEMVVAAIGL